MGRGDGDRGLNAGLLGVQTPSEFTGHGCPCAHTHIPRTHTATQIICAQPDPAHIQTQTHTHTQYIHRSTHICTHSDVAHVRTHTHTHTPVLPQTPLPSRLPHNTEQSPCAIQWLLLVIHFKYGSAYLLIPGYLTIPSTRPSPQEPVSLFLN